MKAVSSLTRFNFNQLWEMGIMEFLNYADFNIRYNKWEEEQQKEYSKKM